MKKNDTMFAEIVRILNANFGKPITENEILAILFEKKFITKNAHGVYYRKSFGHYKTLLKNGKFINFEDFKPEIEILKKIPKKVTPKTLRAISNNGKQ